MIAPAVTLIQLLRTAKDIYGLILLIRVIFSWLRLPSYHWASRTIGKFCYAATEPLLRPIRRWLAPYQRSSAFDFSPVVLYVLIILVEALAERLIVGVAL